MPKLNDGMASQRIYLELLKDEMKFDINFVVSEFVDTRKARNFVAANPSDLFACYKAAPWLIEVKSTIDRARFPMKNIKGTQFGIGRRYRLSGWNYMFVIHHVSWDTWYFVPFDFMYEKSTSGIKSLKWEDLKVFAKNKDHKFWSIHE